MSEVSSGGLTWTRQLLAGHQSNSQGNASDTEQKRRICRNGLGGDCGFPRGRQKKKKQASARTPHNVMHFLCTMYLSLNTGAVGGNANQILESGSRLLGPQQQDQAKRGQSVTDFCEPTQHWLHWWLRGLAGVSAVQIAIQ